MYRISIDEFEQSNTAITEEPTSGLPERDDETGEGNPIFRLYYRPSGDQRKLLSSAHSRSEIFSSVASVEMGRSIVNLSDEEEERELVKRLRARNLISNKDLDKAFISQRRNGEKITKVLLTAGFIERQPLHRILADVWGLEFVDLLRMPPKAELARLLPAEEMSRFGWLPLLEEKGSMLVATCNRPTLELRDHLLNLCEEKPELAQIKEVVFVVTTDWDIQVTIQALFRYNLMHDAAHGLLERTPLLSAKSGLVLWQKIVPPIVGALFLTSVVLFPIYTIVGMVMAFSVLFFASVVFKTMVSVLSISPKMRRKKISERIPDDELPIYTVLVPLHKEENIVGGLIDHLSTLDYPQEKLEILLLLEENDQGTIDVAKWAHPPENVRIIIVPDGQPRTKPRACNVGLFFSRGEYLVIYDAEDRPERDQLRKAVQAFREGTENLACVQASLNYFNARENILTRLFTLEYSQWFDYMLPGLSRLHLPIPLGGTSNHFRVDSLRKLDGWDAYNVTEDADLGLRASAKGYKVGIIDSTTYEEACSRVRPWIRQRTRWIKGYMQTVLVHSRQPVVFARAAGLRGVFGFVFLIAGTPFTFLAAPVLWLLTILWWSNFGPAVSMMDHIPHTIAFINMIGFLVGNVAMIAVNALAVEKRKLWGLLPYAVLSPLYWMLHSFAAWRALYQLIRNPFHWEKTPHGISKMDAPGEETF